MNNMKKMGSVRMVILLSILLALSGMAAITSADTICPPNRFSGTVMLNGAPAPVGTVIEAYIEGDFRGNTTVELTGTYKRLPVNGNYSDGGKTITFTVDGLTADQTDTTWIAMVDHVRMLNLTAGTVYAKGDLDHNGDVADAVDVAMMLQASVGDIIATSEYDLDGNGENADAVDVAMMLQASVGDITLG